jgi:hypothetical protein
MSAMMSEKRGQIMKCQQIKEPKNDLVMSIIAWGDLSGFEPLIREFDPGSGRTLAACLTHASRAETIAILS